MPQVHKANASDVNFTFISHHKNQIKDFETQTISKQWNESQAVLLT